MYNYLCRSYCFVPVGVETSGVFGPQALSFFKDLGRRLRNVSGDPLSYTHLSQQISIAIHKGNAMAIMDSMNLDFSPPT